MKHLSPLILALLGILSCKAPQQVYENGNLPNVAGTAKLTRNIVVDSNTMPYQCIRNGIQDRKGNLWFATTGEGVYRYDGKLFTNFTTKDGLSSNTVWSVMEDTSGNIWFGTDGGACRYDGHTITRLPIAARRKAADTAWHQPNTVWSMLQDRSGVIWFGTNEGVFRYTGSSVSRLLDDPRIVNDSGLKLEMIQCIFQDRAGDLWFCTGLNASEGVGKFDGRTIVKLKPNGEVWVRNIVEDKNGDLYFATRHHGVLRYDGKTFTNISEKAGVGNHDVDAVLLDRSGRIWIATDYAKDLTEGGGLWRLEGTSATRFTTTDGLVQNSIWSMVEDRTGSLWIGTRNTGLSRYDGSSFTTFSE